MSVRKKVGLSLWTGLVLMMASDGAARAGVSVANFVGEIRGTVLYGTKEPPYGEAYHVPIGIGQNVAFNVHNQVAVSGDVIEVTDAQGLVLLDGLFDVQFFDAPLNGPSNCFLEYDYDLILTDPLFQYQASFDVLNFFRLVDPSITGEPIPPGTYHVTSRYNPDGVGIKGGEQGYTTSLGFGLYFLRVPPPTGTTFRWTNAGGGAYGDAANWDPNTDFPVHNATRSDTALFSLPFASFIPVSGPGATAGRWLVSNSSIEFGGSARISSPTVADPSLAILEGGQLRLANGASLDSILTHVGLSGALDSLLEVKSGQLTTSTSTLIGRGSLDVVDGGIGITRALFIGSGNGPGSMRVSGHTSGFEALHTLVVGDTTEGTLEIDRGLFSFSVTPTPLMPTPRIGKSATGTVTVRGDDSSLNLYGRFDVDNSLVVGDGASGRLNVQRGGHVSVSHDLVVGGQRVNSDGQVVIDGQGGASIVDVLRGTFVNATALQEILVHNGGRLTTTDLFIGDLQIRPGMADVTLRGRSGSFPTLTVGMPGGGGQGTFIGDGVPGLLNVEAGASAELYNGLYVGQLAQGIVSVSGLNHPPGTLSTLTVTGETQVGNGGAGIVQLDAVAQMHTNGDVKIGLGGGNPSGSVNLADNSYLRVNGTVSVGESGIGLLNVLSGSAVRCDTLLVGGNSFGATGIVVQGFFSYLTVDGNAQVGMGNGRGEIHLADPEARLVITGGMTIGNPAGGAGGGAVTLVDARIEGTGNIVVNRNGSLTGTGTVLVPHINAGGIISPGLSPGMLTIDGDLELVPGGRLIIEYAGLNPGEFDVLHVTGEATLGGQLEIHFRGGFSPDDPAAFIHSQDFVESDQGLVGDFNRRIFAYPDEFADFDDDGDKDLTDVAAFQNCVGLYGTQLWLECPRADWESDGSLRGVELRELVARLTGPQ